MVSGRYETNEREHTAHVNHGDLKFLPGPTVGPTIHPGDDGFHFVEARKRIQSIHVSCFELASYRFLALFPMKC